MSGPLIQVSSPNCHLSNSLREHLYMHQPDRAAALIRVYAVGLPVKHMQNVPKAARSWHDKIKSPIAKTHWALR
jgi:hypothetical protein